MSKVLTYPLIAVATVLWGANFNLAKHVLADLDPLTAAAARFDIAALVMLALCALRGERVPLLRHARIYGLLGLVGIGAFNVLFFLGMRSTSPVNGALIMSANPLLTALLAVAMSGARLRPRQLVAMPIALAGVAFVVLGGGAAAGAGLHVDLGDLLLIGGSVSWALYNVIVGQRLPRGVSGLANTTGVMSAGALVLTTVALAAGSPVHLPQPGAGAALGLMAIGGSVCAYLFWNAGIARLGAARAAPFMNLVPVSSMLIAACEGQLPTGVQLAGGAAVIGALVLSSWPGRAALPERVAAAPAGAPRPCDA
jgi:drug/metabolite transporter (DMT)-like permease